MDAKKENFQLWIRGFICVFIFIILLILKFNYLPISYKCIDLDKNIGFQYERVQEDYSYIFSLNGIKLDVEGDIVKPILAYSGKNSIPYIAINSNKYYFILPLSLKDLSEKQILEYLNNKTSTIKNAQTSVVSIDKIRNEYQKINIEEVTFYRLNGINRIIYNDLDSFKIVAYSFRQEVTETELYWNKFDSYYYIISPENAEDLFYN